MIEEIENDGEYENNEILENEYIDWKKNSPFLYDILITDSLVWPSLTIEWFSDFQIQEDYKIQRLLIAPYTSGVEEDTLIIASIKTPILKRNSELTSNQPIKNHSEKLKIEKVINHEGEVNKARYCPQKSNLIATKTNSGEVHIFDVDEHPDRPVDSSIKPQKKLVGHKKEGFGLSWNTLKTGILASGSNDNLVCVWDINSDQSSPLITFNNHTNVVEDVCFSRHDDYLLGSSSDDKKIILYDTRTNQLINSLDAHESEVNSIDFNFINKNLILTGSKNTGIKLWDIRNMKYSIYTFDKEDESEIIFAKWNPVLENIFLSNSSDRKINIWDVNRIGEEQAIQDDEEGAVEMIFTHGGHTANVSDCSWNLNENLMIASTSEDNIIHIWQMAEFITDNDGEYFDEQVQDPKFF